MIANWLNIAHCFILNLDKSVCAISTAWKECITVIMKELQISYNHGNVEKMDESFSIWQIQKIKSDRCYHFCE